MTGTEVLAERQPILSIGKAPSFCQLTLLLAEHPVVVAVVETAPTMVVAVAVATVLSLSLSMQYE
jgi:hypothetical protein